MAYWLSNTSTLLFLLQKSLSATGANGAATRRKPPPTSLFGRMTMVLGHFKFLLFIFLRLIRVMLQTVMIATIYFVPFYNFICRVSVHPLLLLILLLH